jgi:hypothetical protein
MYGFVLVFVIEGRGFQGPLLKGFWKPAISLPVLPFWAGLFFGRVDACKT